MNVRQNSAIKILIVEDDHHISSLYSMKLRMEHYEVMQAYNGLEALKLTRHHTFDIILLDLRMPVMDGEKFLEKFRASNHSTAVIVLTNLNKEEAPKTLWHYGISGYFVKAHHTPKELAAIVKNTLGQA